MAVKRGVVTPKSGGVKKSDESKKAASEKKQPESSKVKDEGSTELIEEGEVRETDKSAVTVVNKSSSLNDSMGSVSVEVIRPADVLSLKPEQVELQFEYEALDNKVIESRLKELVIEIREGNRLVLETIYKIGRLLAEAKEMLYETYGRRVYCKWVEDDTGLNVHTAVNYLNVYKTISEYPGFLTGKQPTARVMYALSRSTVPKEVKKAAEEFSSLGVNLEIDPTSPEIRDLRMFLTHRYDIEQESRNLLLAADHPITLDKQELEKLSSLGKRTQSSVTEELLSNTELSVREALKIITENKKLSKEPDENNESEVEEELNNDKGRKDRTLIYTKVNIKTKRGNWRNLIKSIKDDSLDLVLVETPHTLDWLDNYMDLFYELDNKCSNGARILMLVGQQTIYYLGEFLQTTSLKPSWTFYIRRKPGLSKRLPGKNVIAAVNPVAYFYKPPHNPTEGMIADLKIIEESDSTDTTYETAIEYYLERFLTRESRFLYLSCHENKSSFTKLIEPVLSNLKVKPSESHIYIGSSA